MTNVAAAPARLRDGLRRLLRPSGKLAPLTRRGQIFDAAVALCLGLVAFLSVDDGDGVRQEQVHVDQGMPRPDLPVPVMARPNEPFLPIEHGQAGATVVLFVVVLLPLLLRRRYPLAVLWVVLATALLVSDVEGGSDYADRLFDSDAAVRVSFYVCVIAAYTAAVYSPYRIPALATLPVAAFIYAQIREPAVPTVPDDAVPFLILIPLAVVADGLRRWKRHADEGRVRLSTLEREQAEALRRAADHERARIARELHDVVTHNVSVMVIQAGAARKVMPADPDQAREALLAVEAGGRAAMAELRHVMGLLTMDSDDADLATADLTPQPGLGRLETLAQRVRDAGTPVALTVAGQPRPLLPGVELTAYRVVQEALTNTVKHAVGAAATVLVEYGTDELTVEVTDTGGTPGATATTGNGRGLMGLRERVAVYGGTLRVGRRLSGGYRLTARIPLEAT